MTTGPIPSTGPLSTGPLRAASAAPKAAATARAAAAVPKDASLLKPIKSALTTAAVDLEKIAVPVLNSEETSDAVANLMEADRMRGRDAGLTKLGKAAALVAIGLQAKELVGAMRETPMALDRIAGALVGIGVNLGEFFEKGFLGGVAGISNAIQGFQGAAEAVKRMKDEGANPSNVLEALSYATQSLGGGFGTLALVVPAAAPALEAASIGLYMASGALTLAQLAYDKRDWIKDKASKLWGAITGGASSLAARVMPAGTSAPRGAPAS